MGKGGGRFVSHVTCNMSGVRCHMSDYYFLLLTKGLSKSVEGLFSTGPTPSSLLI